MGNSVDSQELVVTLNGGAIDFEGLFPTFPPGAQTVGYTDTFSTRNVDINGNQGSFTTTKR